MAIKAFTDHRADLDILLKEVSGQIAVAKENGNLLTFLKLVRIAAELSRQKLSASLEEDEREKENGVPVRHGPFVQ